MNALLRRCSKAVVLFCVLVALISAGSARVHKLLPFKHPYLIIEHPESNTHTEMALLGVKVNVEMIYSMAKVSVTHSYKNPLPTPAHVTYVFPLDDQAAVTSFMASYDDGRTLVGVSKEKHSARLQFDESVATGHSAVILEQPSPDVFRAQIGNLNPHQEVSITMTYLAPIFFESSDTLRFTLPTLVGARYRPSTPLPPIDENAEHVSYKLTFDMTATMPVPIASISSPTHEITYNVSPDAPNRATISINGNLDGDCVVLVKMDPKSGAESHVVVEFSTEYPSYTAVYMNLHSSEFVSTAKPVEGETTELIFVVDTSGSMMGGKIEDTQKAMLEALKQLYETYGSKNSNIKVIFNVYRFASSYTPLFRSSQPLTESNYDEAKKFVEKFQASGGTELLEPLKEIFSNPVPELHRRRVIVLTDGLVGNSAEIFRLIKENEAHTRVYSVGIGNGVSHALVNGLAQQGSGTAEYVVLDEHVADKMRRQLERAIAASETKLSIEILDAEDKPVTNYIMTPKNLPPMYSDTSLPIYFLIPPTDEAGEARIPTDYTVSITTSDNKKHEFDLRTARHVTSDIVHKMAAKSQIRELEVELMSDEYHHTDAESIRKEIVRIATKYNLASTQTSFVAVDLGSESSSQQTAQQIDVVVEPERGTPTRFAMKAGSMPGIARMRHMTDHEILRGINTMAVDTMELAPEQPLSHQETIAKGQHHALESDHDLAAEEKPRKGPTQTRGHSKEAKKSETSPQLTAHMWWILLIGIIGALAATFIYR